MTRRRFPVGDSITACDLFCGAGGSSQGLAWAGVDVWYAANHNAYAVDLHERYFHGVLGHTHVEHFIADLLDETAKNYIAPWDIPAAHILWASPSCTHRSVASNAKAYREGLTLFDLHDSDPDYEARVTKSERSRATAVCVLQYCRKHRPLVVMCENTVEWAQEGELIPGTKRPDGSLYRWWRRELIALGYHVRELFLNSMFFGAPQSRDRMYVVAWLDGVQAPDLDHRPVAYCHRCDREAEARQAFKPRKASWPLPEWGKYGAQYVYVCSSCGHQVVPYRVPAWTAIDWADLGRTIGERSGKEALSPRTIQRIERGIAKFADWPPFVLPSQAEWGVDRSVLEPMTTNTTRQDKALVSYGGVMTVAGHTFERERSTCRTRPLHEPMGTVHTTADRALVHAPFLTVMRGWRPDADERNCTPITDPTPTIAASGNHLFLSAPPAQWTKVNGGPGDTAWHWMADPLGTITARDTSSMLTHPDARAWVDEYRRSNEPRHPTEVLSTATTHEQHGLVAGLRSLATEDYHYRPLKPVEYRAAQAFDPRFPLIGSQKDQVAAFGNAVTPPVSEWLAERVLSVLRGDDPRC